MVPYHYLCLMYYIIVIKYKLKHTTKLFVIKGIQESQLEYKYVSFK